MGHSDILSIGIDTWGVDYGLIDKHGEMIGNPYHYRDLRTYRTKAKIVEKFDKDFLYSETGIQNHEFNTIYQLTCEAIPQTADRLLFMHDLFAYFLTGENGANALFSALHS